MKEKGLGSIKDVMNQVKVKVLLDVEKFSRASESTFDMFERGDTPPRAQARFERAKSTAEEILAEIARLSEE